MVLSEMARSSQEQATGLAEVNIAVNQMDQVTQLNAAMLGKATDAASRLRSAAAEMSALMNEFRVGDDEEQEVSSAAGHINYDRRPLDIVVPIASFRR